MSMKDELDIVAEKIVYRGIVYHHYLCNLCGKELSTLNLKRGFLLQKRHRIVTLSNGIQMRICYNGKKCKENYEKLVKSRKEYERESFQIQIQSILAEMQKR